MDVATAGHLTEIIRALPVISCAMSGLTSPISPSSTRPG
jgi:hypothetical protein